LSDGSEIGCEVRHIAGGENVGFSAPGTGRQDNRGFSTLDSNFLLRCEIAWHG